ncbi:MAG: serine/threonine-protein kinase [Polyangiaceae bacterium]
MAARHHALCSGSYVVAGRYRLLERIGEGGHGAVYRAEQIGLSRPVALKQLHPWCMGPEEMLRFRREAEIIQGLDHPNTVRLLDFGVDGAAPFIVYELLSGCSLRALLRTEGALSEERALRILRQVLGALVQAHSSGVVHRDIKPANIFVSQYAGMPDFARVLDFGIAKSPAHAALQLTRPGDVLGTPFYMAPEQVVGADVTPATDVYALGLVAAEMLTGVRAVSGSAVEALARHLSSEPIRPPASLEGSPLLPIVLQATVKQPAWRFRNAEAMLNALDSWAGASEVSSRTAPMTARLGTPPERRFPLAVGE